MDIGDEQDLYVKLAVGRTACQFADALKLSDRSRIHYRIRKMFEDDIEDQGAGCGDEEGEVGEMEYGVDGAGDMGEDAVERSSPKRIQ